jgi:hypothetical protein
MALIKRPDEETRGGKGKKSPDISTEIAIARYEYSAPPKRRPRIHEENEEELLSTVPTS